VTEMTRSVEMVDVTSRDGLQSEETLVPTEGKLRLIEAAVAAGARRVEVCSFVNAARVPQMGDAEDVIAGLPRHDDVVYSGLVLNERGFDRAAATGIAEINVVIPVTDTFSLRNQGCTVEEGLVAFEAIAARAAGAGIATTATLAVSFGCPYEGEVDPSRVGQAGQRVAAAGADEIALADTIGVAVPTDVSERFALVRDAVEGAGKPGLRFRAHFHNTRNSGLANAVAALGAGVSALDASIGGIGGCPFAPNATGNVPMEDLVYLLERMGVSTGMDLRALVAAVPLVETTVAGTAPGLLSKAGIFPPPVK
jgi:hydroxymethylglutaryl-CoA lyase